MISRTDPFRDQANTDDRTRIIKIVAILGLAIFVFAICELYFISTAGSSSSIKVSVLIDTDTNYPVLISVTNFSKKIVKYDMGGTVLIAFFQAGAWKTNLIDHFFREVVILAPGTSDQFRNYREISPDTKGIKVRVGFENLPWQGRLSLTLYRWRLFKPIAQWLDHMDKGTYPNEEWSEVVMVDPKGQP